MPNHHDAMPNYYAMLDHHWVRHHHCLHRTAAEGAHLRRRCMPSANDCEARRCHPEMSRSLWLLDLLPQAHHNTTCLYSTTNNNDSTTSSLHLLWFHLPIWLSFQAWIWINILPFAHGRGMFHFLVLRPGAYDDCGNNHNNRRTNLLFKHSPLPRAKDSETKCGQDCL
jgi:hypothetical protein